jgi:outer membrane protein
MKNFCKLALIIGAQVAISQAYATDLLDVWKSAQVKDPGYIASRYEQLAGEKRKEQSDSIFRPNIFLSATTGYMTSNSSTAGAYFSAPGMGPASNAIFKTSVNGGTLAQHTLTAVQPIYNKEKSAQKSQLRSSADMSELGWQQAQQNLIILVAERYFDVLKAEESLRLTRKQEVAIGKMFAEIKKRQQLGDAAQTDLQEAAQKMDATQIGIVNAEMDLKVKKMALDDLMVNAQDLKHLTESIDLSSLSLESLDHYLTKMKSQNIGLKIAGLSQDISKAEVAKYAIFASPQIDIVAQTSRDRLSGSGDYGSSASNTLSNYMVGLQLTLPLYTGGYRSAKYEESLNNLEKSKTEYERASLDTEKVLRQIWMALSTSKNRISAMRHSKETSDARLISTRNGHKVGSRSTLELLGAEIDAIASEQILFIEQTNYLLNRLRLASIISELGEGDLRSVNAYLK